MYPAVALADELVARGRARSSILFVGATRGIEATAVPAAGYEIELLPGRGLLRSLTPRAVIQNLRTLFDTARAFGGALAHRRTPAPGRRRRCRRLRVAARGRSRTVPPHSCGRARVRRSSRSRQPHRGAARGTRRGLVAGDAPARCGRHRQPHPARDRRRGGERRCRRRWSRSWAGASAPAGSTTRPWRCTSGGATAPTS